MVDILYSLKLSHFLDEVVIGLIFQVNGSINHIISFIFLLVNHLFEWFGKGLEILQLDQFDLTQASRRIHKIHLIPDVALEEGAVALLKTLRPRPVHLNKLQIITIIKHSTL